jgi:hypothetical protein
MPSQDLSILERFVFDFCDLPVRDRVDIAELATELRGLISEATDGAVKPEAFMTPFGAKVNDKGASEGTTKVRG